jgi:hypothetical protein
LKYDLETSLEEIGKRKSKRLDRRTRFKTLLTGGVTAALAFMTVLSYLLVLPPGAEKVGESPYGAFLIGSGGGGYVLVGVLAFAFGATFTLLCIYLTKIKKAKTTEKNDQNDQKTED